MLVAAWKRNLKEIEEQIGERGTVFFASAEEDSGEDEMNTALMMDTAQEAGWKTKFIKMEEISHGPDNYFYHVTETDYAKIDVIFKLYPWEHMVESVFGEVCFKSMEKMGKKDENGKRIGGTIWIEAPYKMLWSNKAILAILWELFKDDERSKWLLPTYFEDEKPKDFTTYAKKPIFAREGAGVTLVEDSNVLVKTDDDGYGSEGYVVQELARLPEFKDMATGTPYYPVLGLWVVDGDPAGMGIRESKGLVTGNTSYFIPHSISDAKINFDPEPVPTLEEIEASIKAEADALEEKEKEEAEALKKEVEAFKAAEEQKKLALEQRKYETEQPNAEMMNFIKHISPQG